MFNVNKKLYDDIVGYCELNNIQDIELFCNQMLEKGFMNEKYSIKHSLVKNSNNIIINSEIKKVENKSNKSNIIDNYEGIYE